jgi:pimeloyl-ACP methyl ester carboxylesterase
MTDVGLEPFSRFYISQRQRLHYVDWGNPDAPPLILVHGGLDNCRSWDWVAREFREHWHVIAPDLRGHGDSAWSQDGAYSFDSFIYDLAELIHVLGLDKAWVVAHSLGGNIALRFAGVYPEKVAKLVAIEGLGPSPVKLAERQMLPLSQHMRDWVEKRRHIASRLPRRYKSLDEALERMVEENKHLTRDRARHLTIHGTIRNEDGSYSWKFDNYVRSMPPDFALSQPDALWAAIQCPTLLVYGADSWASNPAVDGRASYFKTAEVSLIEAAGHFVHHDQHDVFVSQVTAFLAREA